MSLKYKISMEEANELIANAPLNYALHFGLGNKTIYISDEKLKNGIPYEMRKLAELRGVIAQQEEAQQ